MTFLNADTCNLQQKNLKLNVRRDFLYLFDYVAADLNNWDFKNQRILPDTKRKTLCFKDHFKTVFKRLFDFGKLCKNYKIP